ncbi:MAG TPA: hypothetical protein PLA68_11030 [Panacibacter sp.]|nr:hypothetical protein [Panacibacter sp.]
MKNIIVSVAIAVFFSAGCSSAYKATSTPDDVYYSPAPPANAEVQDSYDDYSSSNSDDNYLRMKVRNRYQWNGIDDYGYWNDSRYDFGYSCSPSRSVLLNPFNPLIYGNTFGYSYYSPWGSWYSPYSTIVYYKNPQVYYGNTSKTNLTAYRNRNYYTNANRNSFGSLLKQTFGTSANNNNFSNNNNSTRTFNTNTTPSNNAGGRSGGFNSTGSSSGSSRPPRGKG